MILSYNDIMGMEKIPRLNLVNTLVGYKSANLIGSIDQKGNSNLAIFSSAVHMGSNPPLIGMVTRPTTVERHTYSNLKATGYYTINSISSGMIERAHQTSAKYDTNESEFQTCDFEEYYSENHPAPYVRESAVKIGLSFVEEYLIKANDTILVIGKIEELILPDDAVTNDGFLDLSQHNIVAISGLDTYLLPDKLARFSYARKGQSVTRID